MEMTAHDAQALVILLQGVLCSDLGNPAATLSEAKVSSAVSVLDAETSVFSLCVCFCAGVCTKHWCCSVP